MPTPDLVAAPARLAPCIVLIGMAGAGKSTVGGVLARELGWAFLDSDHLIEALYGVRLQDVTDALGKEAFLDAECTVIRAIKANRTVIGTGGSLLVGRLMFQMTIYPAAWITLCAFTLSVALGILFGIYPAAKAARLQPVEALRAE